MELTHLNGQGRARMVDVTEKAETFRTALAEGSVRMSAETLELVRTGGTPKGDVLAVAQVAGIMAAKRTHELIPMCHPIRLTGVDIRFAYGENAVLIRAEARCKGETGVEMEALTAVSTAALTIYDMLPHPPMLSKLTPFCAGRPAGKAAITKRSGDMARVTSVNISEKKGTVKHPVEEARLLPHHGIVGDAHAGDWHRQVSMLAEESVDKLRDLLPQLKAGAFAENINTVGIDLKSLPVGTRLQIGTAVAEVTQIGKECHNDCAIKKATGTCVMPTEGIFAAVLQEGTVRAGDPVEIIEEAAE